MTVTVLGIGNVLMRDEGVGVRLMEAVRQARPWPEEVRFVDGGVGGLGLLNVIESAGRLVVFDAADLRLPPGEHRVFSPDEVAPDRSEGRISLHETTFLETLELCRRFFRAPPTVFLAVQPEAVGPGRSLSETLQAAFPALVATGARLVEDASSAPPEKGELT